MLNRLSLRMRITVLSALCLLLICIFLTLYLVSSAGMTFYTPYETVAETIPAMTIAALEEGGVAVARGQPAEKLYAARSYSLAAAPTFAAYADSVYQTVQSRFSLTSFLIMAGFILLGTLLTWIITGAALRPVSALSRRIEATDIDNLSAPIPVPGTRDEVARLAESFNHMLAKVQVAYDAQRRFAQNAAHELKTPMANMLANIDVAEIGQPNVQELQEALAEVRTGAERMAKLIEDMLSLQASAQGSGHTTFLFSEILPEILLETKRDMDEKKLSFALEGDAVLRGDRALLLRAFTNLVQNAARYNVDEGSISIRCTDDAVAIIDTGIGIAPDAMAHIFEPFYCADPSRSRALGGSGLGLSIARQIFALHGMEVQIESGEGTVVTVFTGCSQRN